MAYVPRRTATSTAAHARMKATRPQSARNFALLVGNLCIPSPGRAFCSLVCLGTNHFIVSCKNSGISASGSTNTGGFCCSGDGALDCCSDTKNLLPLAAATSTAQAAFVISVTLSSTVSIRFTTLSGTRLSPLFPLTSPSASIDATTGYVTLVLSRSTVLRSHIL